jgi:hypothetical protein
MFGMASSDLISSIAIALTTLPMPKDMIYTQFEGMHIGSTCTCTFQFCSVYFGATSSLWYNFMLAVYHFQCMRRLLSSERNMQMKYEYALHICCFTFPAIPLLSIYFLGLDLVNPSPFVPWCSVSPMPYWCGEFNGTEEAICSEYRERKMLMKLMPVIFVIMSLIPYVAVIALLMSTVMSYHSKRNGDSRTTAVDADHSHLPSCDEGSNDEIMPTPKDDNSKAIVIQACSYVLGLSITATCVFNGASFDATMAKGNLYILVVRPLQGFFNLVVFFGDKVYNYKMNHPAVSTFRAAVQVCIEPIQQDYYFSDISMILREVEPLYSHNDNAEDSSSSNSVQSSISLPSRNTISNSCDNMNLSVDSGEFLADSSQRMYYLTDTTDTRPAGKTGFQFDEGYSHDDSDESSIDDDDDLKNWSAATFWEGLGTIDEE